MEGEREQENEGAKRVQEMVLQRCKEMRGDGLLQSLEDIFSKQPQSRITKENYFFSFDLVKNRMQDRVTELERISVQLKREASIVRNIQIREAPSIIFDNQDDLYGERLQSGLPIFKTIMFMRYQGNTNYSELFGEQRPFTHDQSNVDVVHSKTEVGKLALFLEERTLPKINLEFINENTLVTRYQHFPTLQDIETRADVMAKLFLLGLYNQEKRKLKQAYKNEDFFKVGSKKKKGQNDDEKKETIPFDLLRRQVQKVFRGVEERANAIAHQHFKQLNGQKAVQTKKSLQKLKRAVEFESDPNQQLRMLIAYKQKKAW